MSVNINPQTKTVEAGRQLRRSGSSFVVTLPPELIQALDWAQGDNLRLSADWDSGELVIRAE